MASIARNTDQPDHVVNFKLPHELHEAVVKRSEAEDRSMAQTFRVALRYYLQETTPLTGA